MFPAFYLYPRFLIVCTLFLLFLSNFLTHDQSHRSSSTQKRTSVVSDSHRSSNNTSTRENLINVNEEHNTKIFLRQKPLGINSNNQSLFHRFKFTYSTKSICANLLSPADSLIIVVLSQAFNFDNRLAIRTTWGQNGKYRSSHFTVQSIFFVGTDDRTQSAVRNEQTIFNDVVEIHVPENDAFAVYKELAALFWLRLYCPLARFLFRIDDNIFLNIFLLLNYLEYRINLSETDGIYGWFRSDSPVLRTGKRAVTKNEYHPNIYPPYTSNTGYLFSNHSCQLLIKAANHPKQYAIRHSEAYITGILRDIAQISYFTYSNVEQMLNYQLLETCDSHFEQRPRLLMCTSRPHGSILNDVDEYYDVWDVLLKRYN